MGWGSLRAALALLVLLAAPTAQAQDLYHFDTLRTFLTGARQVYDPLRTPPADNLDPRNKAYAQRALYRFLAPPSAENQAAATNTTPWDRVPVNAIFQRWKAAFAGVLDPQMSDAVTFAAFAQHMTAVEKILSRYRGLNADWSDASTLRVLEAVDDLRQLDRFDLPKALQKSGEDPRSITTYDKKVDEILASVELAIGDSNFAYKRGYHTAPGRDWALYQEVVRQSNVRFPPGWVQVKPIEANVIGASPDSLNPRAFIEGYMDPRTQAIDANADRQRSPPPGNDDDDGDVQ